MQSPVQDKEKLVDELKQALADAAQFCASLGVDLALFQKAVHLDRLNLLRDAIETLIAPDDTRKTFLAHEKLVEALYKA